MRVGFTRALNAARGAGATVVEVDLDGWQPSAARRAGLLVAEAEGAVEMRALMASEGALSEGFRAMLEYGAAASSGKLVVALARGRAASAACARGLAAADALILPTAPQRAFRHGSPVPANQADLTALANFAGCPAVAFPVPLPGETLPASVQVIAPHWSEARLLAIAETLDRRLNAN